MMQAYEGLTRFLGGEIIMNAIHSYTILLQKD
jgi:hypothetical protein